MSYVEVQIRGCSGGFGEFDVAPDAGDRFADKIDILAAAAEQYCDIFRLGDDFEAAQIDGPAPEDIRGRIHNEPTEVYAYREVEGWDWKYFGINEVWDGLTWADLENDHPECCEELLRVHPGFDPANTEFSYILFGSSPAFEFRTAGGAEGVIEFGVQGPPSLTMW